MEQLTFFFMSKIKKGREEFTKNTPTLWKYVEFKCTPTPYSNNENTQ